MSPVCGTFNRLALAKIEEESHGTEQAYQGMDQETLDSRFLLATVTSHIQH
jgi:hypothetical protein